ncbi:Cell division cycle-associated 7-like protein [Bienertia sinuspersici]
MVMTLRTRTRVQAIESEPESDSESDLSMEMETPQKKKRGRKMRQRHESEPESDSESDLAMELETPQKKKRGRKMRQRHESSDSDKENEVAVGYEKFREQRIQENKERLLKLGIFSLSSQLFNSSKKSIGRKKKTPAPAPKKKKYPPLYPRPRSSRRSTRLINVGNGEFLESEELSAPEAWKRELYTEEDEKLLGNCDTEWTLNVDGFSEDGDRLYDPDGTPCHQCRQKILGKLTYCGKCRSPQGQLCGDCLYTRYGENVLEAIQNPSWSCPVCRGICNCSRCRRTKGWEPINIQHSKLVESGFKSVAHYLILTRRADAAPMELNDATPLVDLTTEETTAPQNEGSDYAAESSESESDDSDSEDDSKVKSNNKEQSVEIQAEESNEVAVATPTDKDQVLEEPTLQYA